MGVTRRASRSSTGMQFAAKFTKTPAQLLRQRQKPPRRRCRSRLVPPRPRALPATCTHAQRVRVAARPRVPRVGRVATARQLARARASLRLRLTGSNRLHRHHQHRCQQRSVSTTTGPSRQPGLSTTSKTGAIAATVAATALRVVGDGEQSPKVVFFAGWIRVVLSLVYHPSTGATQAHGPETALASTHEARPTGRSGTSGNSVTDGFGDNLVTPSLALTSGATRLAHSTVAARGRPAPRTASSLPTMSTPTQQSVMQLPPAATHRISRGSA